VTLDGFIPHTENGDLLYLSPPALHYCSAQPSSLLNYCDWSPTIQFLVLQCISTPRKLPLTTLHPWKHLLYLFCTL
jgi:hypothetical protein